MASQQSCPADQIAEKDTHSRKQLHARSTDVRQAVVPSFKRYSEGTRKSATPAASQDTDQFDEALEILDKIGAQPVSTLGENCCYDAKFAVDEVVGQGRRSGQIVYKVEWTSSKVPSRLLRYVDGRPEVKCGKQEYTVRSVCPLSPELGTNDEPQLLVAWKSTWEDEEVVKALARPHLETFLRKMRESQERDEPEDSLMQPDQGRESPIVSALELPQQAIVYSTNFKPQRRLVYNDAMRRLLRGAAGDVGEMLCYPDKNDLIFRHHYIEKNTAFNAECNRMRRAAALQMVGVKQRKKCDHCKKGCGPFRGCVVLTGFGRGACANCLYGARMPMTCNYHCRSRAERPRQPEIVSASAEGEYRDISRATTHSNDHTASPTAVAVTPDAVKEDVAGRAPQSPDTAHLMQRSPSPLALEEQKRERACSRELLPEHRIEGSSSLAEPAYLSPMFRHPKCRGTPSSCTHPAVSYSNQRRRDGRVQEGRVFQPGEASDQQVRWLIALSGCSMTEFLQRVWEWRLQKHDQEPLPPGWRKETFISHSYWAELNWTAEQVGRGRSVKAKKVTKVDTKRGKKWRSAKTRI